MDIPPDVRYVVREGRSIAYQRFGSGEGRAVSFGNIGNLDLLWSDPSFYDGALQIAARSEILVFDQLGFGLSDPVDHVPTFEERAADLGAVMDAAGFERATICPIYDCCLTSMVFAAQHPARVEGLVLLSPYAQGFRSAPFEELVGWDSPYQVEAYDRAWRDVIASWGRGASLRFEFPELATPRNMRVWGMLERAWTGPAMLHALDQVASTADVRDVLPSVQAPALVLRRPGNMLPEGVMRHVAERLPNGSYKELPAANSIGEFFADYVREIERFMFGSVRDVNPDRALMTVLFTDIVGSTEQVASLGDAGWRELLGKHERMLRGEVEAVGGRVVKLIGDGSLSTFDGPARAIRCAERICAAAGELGLRVRAGLHTGECEVVDDDVVGMAVNIAARVSAQAGPGEVLVSRTVRDLVTGSGVALQSRGERELKGVPGSWELFAVGTETAPLPPPDQTRELRASDRLVLLTARRAPGLLRAASRRIGTRPDQR
jgi:class 3 adenylate cyclase/pimeloyl-ACP methyl ester carboxylesterase